jgi:hypothetical protein
MQINGAPYDSPIQRGHVLLLAGGMTGKRRNIHRPAANLAALASAQVSALLGDGVAADVVQLLDEAEPQALLTRLRTAAATPGPLAIYLSGQLTIDRRQHQLHLALARTTALTVRYTAMPWWWLRHELRARPVARTAVFADLTADAAAWRVLCADPSLLPQNLPLYGVVTPPETPSDGKATAYTRHLAELLRHSRTPRHPAELHRLAATHSALGGSALWYAPTPPPAPVVPAQASAPGPAARPVAPTVPVQPPAAPQQAPPDPRQAPEAWDARKPREARDEARESRDPWELRDQWELRDPREARDSREPGEPQEAREAQEAQEARDPHRDIWRAVQAGRHTEAAAMAAAWEEHALRTTGPDSQQSRHWLEIRADLARRAGDHVLATELCIAIAQVRLRQHSPDARQVGTAVDNAHHCWERVTDPTTAHRLAPGLIALRRVVPGPGDRLLRAAQQRLERLERPVTQEEPEDPEGPLAPATAEDGLGKSSPATA